MKLVFASQEETNAAQYIDDVMAAIKPKFLDIVEHFDALEMTVKKYVLARFVGPLALPIEKKRIFALLNHFQKSGLLLPTSQEYFRPIALAALVYIASKHSQNRSIISKTRVDFIQNDAYEAFMFELHMDLLFLFWKNLRLTLTIMQPNYKKRLIMEVVFRTMNGTSCATYFGDIKWQSFLKNCDLIFECETKTGSRQSRPPSHNSLRTSKQTSFVLKPKKVQNSAEKKVRKVRYDDLNLLMDTSIMVLHNMFLKRSEMFSSLSERL